MNTWIEFAGEMLMVANGSRYKIVPTCEGWELRTLGVSSLHPTLAIAKSVAAVLHGFRGGSDVRA